MLIVAWMVMLPGGVLPGECGSRLESMKKKLLGSAAQVSAVLAPLRERGARLAIDDVGAGFANLRHILRLAPDIVKLDLSLTHEIARDPAREALASSLVGFAGDVGASIVAEGISSDEDLVLLRALGVDYGQGFHLARPSALLH